MSFSIDILKDARAELDMYQSLANHKLDDKEYEDKMNDLNDAIKALESNNFNDSIHSVMCSVKTTDLISLDYGEEYIERFECPNCKNPIEMDNFCSSCGSKIEE